MPQTDLSPKHSTEPEADAALPRPLSKMAFVFIWLFVFSVPWENMSVIEGSLGILPRRILVHEEDNRAARQLLADAGLSHELRPDE